MSDFTSRTYGPGDDVPPGGKDTTEGRRHDKNQPRVLRFKTLKQITEGSSVRRWIIKGLAAEGEVAGTIAGPGLGKTSIVVNKWAHVAAGKPEWRGMKIPKKRGILYIALERHLQVERMLKAYIKKGLISKDDPFSVVGHIVDLMDQGCVEAIINAIDDTTKATGFDTDIVVVDTRAKGVAAGGGQENSGTDQNIVAANLRAIINHFEDKIHIETVGHTGKDEAKGERGSNASKADYDVELGVTRAGAGPSAIHTMKITKANELEDGKVITTFSLQSSSTGEVDEDNEEQFTWIVPDQSQNEAAAAAAAEEAGADSQWPRPARPLHRAIVRVLADGAGEWIKPWAFGPMVHAAPVEAVRDAFNDAMPFGADAEDTDEDEPLETRRERWRKRRWKRWNAAREAAGDRVVFREIEGKTWIWLGSRNSGPPSGDGFEPDDHPPEHGSDQDQENVDRVYQGEKVDAVDAVDADRSVYHPRLPRLPNPIRAEMVDAVDAPPSADESTSTSVSYALTSTPHESVYRVYQNSVHREKVDAVDAAQSTVYRVDQSEKVDAVDAVDAVDNARPNGPDLFDDRAAPQAPPVTAVLLAPPALAGHENALDPAPVPEAHPQAPIQVAETTPDALVSAAARRESAPQPEALRQDSTEGAPNRNSRPPYADIGSALPYEACAVCGDGGMGRRRYRRERPPIAEVVLHDRCVAGHYRLVLEGHAINTIPSLSLAEKAAVAKGAAS